ncbi:MAG: YeeE/YedE thiosulfate transporter family protein [Bacillota bacterium]
MENIKTKKVWSYRTGAILLAILNIILFAVAGKQWKVTSGITYWAAWLWQGLGGNPEQWYFFSANSTHAKSLQETVFTNEASVMNLGLVAGALISILFLSQFKIRKVKSKKQAAVAILGGFLMGYGARVAMGCNIGGFFSAIPSLSLSGWVFGISVFAGVWVGSKILIRFLL